MEYAYKKQIKASFEETVKNTTRCLMEEGFGILTEIDVKKTLKNKLNVDFDKYLILGACNPANAYKALQSEKDVGLLLPCNVIVYENQEKTFVATILPTVAMSMVGNHALAEVAQIVEKKLKIAIDNI